MDALLRKRLSAHTRFRYCIRSSVDCFAALYEKGCARLKKYMRKKFRSVILGSEKGFVW